MLKRCFKCGRFLDLDEFYAHPMMADGHLGKCKDCTRVDVRRRYYDKYDDVMQYEHRRNATAARRSALTEGAKRRYRESEIVRTHRAASAMASRALKQGRLVKGPCANCGTTDRVQAHHDDYSKPLDVVWLCEPCHRATKHRPLGPVAELASTECMTDTGI